MGASPFMPPPNVAPSLDTSHVSQGSRKALSFPSEEMDCEEFYALQRTPSLPDMGLDIAELAHAKAEHDALQAQVSLYPPGVCSTSLSGEEEHSKLPADELSADDSSM